MTPCPWWTEDKVHALSWEKNASRMDVVSLRLRLDRNPAVQVSELERLPLKSQRKPS
jgi:hypothetical protein